VHFSVVSPSSVKPASGFVVDFYAHLAKHQAEVQRRAKQDADGENIRIKEKGPVEVARGTVLTARLEVQGFVVDDPVDTILWEGDIGNATFFVQVPDDVPPGTRRGLIEVSATGVRIARIDFMVRIGGAATRPDVQRARETRCRAAFASYSRQDTDDVLKMVQMVRLAMPYLEIYMDKTSLRPGQGLHWETELYRMIMGSDVFYLFWSQNAKASAWVEKEWRYALSNRGLDFIAPVPLISPEVAAPPPELEALHFDDLHLRLRR
jgi:hypothetical protein